MTNEELFTDLKQFITTTISQEMAHVATKDDIKELSTRIDSLDARVDSLDVRIGTIDEKIDLVQDAIAESVTHTDSIVQDHDRRLHKLERRPA